MKKLILVIFSAFTLLSQSVWALDLAEAKKSGLVGETPSGYLAAVNDGDGAVKSLISSVNKKRKAQYEKIAKQNGTSVKKVEALAGEKAMQLTQPGHYIKLDGKWVKK